jgi:predicted DNA-binding transcriptional regulator YafY
VYRFTAETIERGMQAGWKSKDFNEFFEQWVKGSIPQPLTYLIDNATEIVLEDSESKPKAATAARLGRHSRRITEREAARIASALLKGEVTEANLAEPEEVFSLNTSALIALLKSAQEHHTGVWIGYAEADGSTSTQIVEPIRMGDGTMTAFDHGSANVRTFAISRISGIAPAKMNEINN